MKTWHLEDDELERIAEQHHLHGDDADHFKRGAALLRDQDEESCVGNRANTLRGLIYNAHKDARYALAGAFKDLRSESSATEQEALHQN